MKSLYNMDRFFSKLPAQSLICFIVSSENALNLIPCFQKSLFFKLWISVRHDKPVIKEYELPNHHIGLIVFTKYKTALAHCKTRIAYTYCPECKKRCVSGSHGKDTLSSVLTQKKEIIGNFRNPGMAYGRDSEEVSAYDFPSDAAGRGIPYGIYDTVANTGTVYVGTSFDTPEIAVGSVAKWRNELLSRSLILAYGGGGNSSRSRVWKHGLWEKICNRYGTEVSACRYPPGCSKWNPIEHRLFNAISNNKTMVKYIRTTKTAKGLKVDAYIVEKAYKKGVQVSDKQLSLIRLEKHETFPKWNYTLKPKRMFLTDS